MNVRKSVVVEQLLADRRPSYGGVGGVVGDRAVVVDEAHEPGVLDAVGLGARRGVSTRSSSADEPGTARRRCALARLDEPDDGLGTLRRVSRCLELGQAASSSARVNGARARRAPTVDSDVGRSAGSRNRSASSVPSSIVPGRS